MNIQYLRALSCPADFRFSLLLFFRERYLDEERSPGNGESDPCEYSRLLTWEKSGLELGLVLASGPLGNLPAKKADRPKVLAWHGGGGFCLNRELSRIS